MGDSVNGWWVSLGGKPRLEEEIKSASLFRVVDLLTERTCTRASRALARLVPETGSGFPTERICLYIHTYNGQLTGLHHVVLVGKIAVEAVTFEYPEIN